MLRRPALALVLGATLMAGCASVGNLWDRLTGRCRDCVIVSDGNGETIEGGPIFIAPESLELLPSPDEIRSPDELHPPRTVPPQPMAKPVPYTPGM